MLQELAFWNSASQHKFALVAERDDKKEMASEVLLIGEKMPWKIKSDHRFMEMHGSHAMNNN
jgi:hypothetical protein